MKKKILIIIVILIFTFAAGFINFRMTNYTKLRGDSGFDSSYDSGSSSSSSSSSRDHFNSNSSSYSSGESSGSSNELKTPLDWIIIFGLYIIMVLPIIIGIAWVFLSIVGVKRGIIIIFLFASWIYLAIKTLLCAIVLLVLFIILVIIYAHIEQKKHYKEEQEARKKLNEKLHKYGYSEEILAKEFYNIYVDVQKAWMNFEYDKLRTLLTDELYNQYEMQLKTLQEKQEKNIMSDFVLKDCYVTDIRIENNMLTIKCEMDVEFYDYIVDESDTCIRGSKDKKLTNYYEMVFVKSLDNNVGKCPNCGAKLSNKSRKCEHCGSVVTTVSDKWVLSKKEVLF